MAALCVDVDIAEIHTTLRNSVIKNIALIVLLGLAFVAAFLIWSGRYVTRPIEQLEHSVVAFASKCRDQRDPEALQIEVPPIHTGE